MSAGVVAAIAMTAAASAAAVTDVRTRRIPNVLTASLAVIALALHATGGLAAFADAFIIMLLVLLVGTLPFWLGWFGGGDVKLLAACGAAVGSQGVAPLLFDVLLAGGVLALIEAARRRRVGMLFRSTASVVMGTGPTLGLHVPYGLAIAAGTIVYTGSIVFHSH